MRYIKLIACRVMFREVSLIAATTDAIVDVTWLEQGLHSKIGGLAVALQAEIDSIESGADIHTTYPQLGNDFDAIVLGYGLCSNGAVGLSTKRYPLVIPRAHDCITLFLGSKEAYRQAFDENPGTMWNSAGWGEGGTDFQDEELREAQRQEFVERYGEEMAAEMAEVMDQMLAHYTQVGMISWPEFEDAGFMRWAKGYVTRYAADHGWRFQDFVGDSTLMRDMLSGNWDDGRFITIPPGKKSAPSYGDDIFKYVD